MREKKNGSTKTYLMLQVLLAVISAVTILAGSFYFEKYREEWITSLLVTLVLGAVYGKILKEYEYVAYWKGILLLHTLNMLLITVGFLMDGFYKPVVVAPLAIGSFLAPELGLFAAVYYGVTAVLYTMETGELLMLYLLISGVGIYFLREFFSSDQILKRISGILLLFVLQGVGAGLFRYYMYREIGLAVVCTGAAIVAVLTGIFSMIMPFLFSEEVEWIPEALLKKKNFGRTGSRNKRVRDEEDPDEERKAEKKKSGQSLLLDENSELFEQLKENPELYQHSLTVAKIAEEAAASIDADRILVRAGAMYHDIGKLVSGEDYVIEGVALCREHHVLDRVIRIVEEHNVNYKPPTSKEAAAVMLADTVVSTVEFHRKKRKETDLELLVEKIFQVRKEKGSLDGAHMTEIELELMEEAIKKEVGVL